jgi:hypothetical protein
LDIKGNSIINYDEENSFSKRTSKNSKEFIDKVLKGGKIILRKLMDELDKNVNLMYRFNENTVLLKVV